MITSPVLRQSNAIEAKIAPATDGINSMHSKVKCLQRSSEYAWQAKIEVHTKPLSVPTKQPLHGASNRMEVVVSPRWSQLILSVDIDRSTDCLYQSQL